MARPKEHADQSRHERLEELVRIEDKVTEAAEAAAEAASHAVEATQAAEAASAARAARKAKAAQKTAKSASTAKKKAEKAAQAAKLAKAAGAETTQYDALPAQPNVDEEPDRIVKLQLTADELDLVEQLAAEKDLPVPDLARSLLQDALGRSRASRDESRRSRRSSR